jgi:dTDP-4-dehydrorhamnose 3,5-epimerase
MIFEETILKGSYVIYPEPRVDERGWFARTYCKKEFAAIGHTKEWVQMNHSFTAMPGTVRGMHFQYAPYGEIKMLRCIAGAAFDVIVDLRKKSATYLQWFGTEITALNKKIVYIPAGFAHGFQTLAADTELVYHHSGYYHPAAEGGVRFDDPSLQVKWPLPVSQVSIRDQGYNLIDLNFKAYEE